MSEFRGDIHLARGFEKWSEMLDKRSEEEKNRAREFKALQELADVTGIAPKDSTTVVDLDTLRGMVEGTMANRQMEKERVAADYTRALTEQLQRRAAAAEQLPDFVRAYVQAPGTTANRLDFGTGTAPGMFEGVPVGPTELDRARYASGVAPGAWANENIGNMLVALSRMAGEGQRQAPGAAGLPMEMWGKAFGVEGLPSKQAVVTGPRQLQVFGAGEVGDIKELPDGTKLYFNGSSWEPMPKETKSKVPESFNNRINSLADQITSAQAMLEDPAIKPADKATAERMIKSLQKRGQNLIKWYRAGKTTFDEGELEGAMISLGIEPEGIERGVATDKAQLLVGEGTKGAKAEGGYVIGRVYKGGLKYLGGDPKKESSWEKVR